MAAIPDKERAAVYNMVREALVKCGVGLTYDWLHDNETYTPAVLFKKTSEALELADLVVADVTFPSTGVGQQISQAIAKKIPVLILKAKWKQPSKFTPGVQSDLVWYVEYEKGNLKSLIKENIRKIGKERFEKFNLILTPDLNSILQLQSEKIGVSKSQLLRSIIRSWLSSHEKD